MTADGSNSWSTSAGDELQVIVTPQPVEIDPETVGAAVLAVPGVARLHGGTFGEVATYLPGRRFTGVRLGDGHGPVEVHVVADPAALAGRGLPALAEQVAAAATALTRRPTAVHIADIDVPGTPDPADPADG